MTIIGIIVFFVGWIVADYIHFSLLHETIEPTIKDKQEHLLIQLKKFRLSYELH